MSLKESIEIYLNKLISQYWTNFKDDRYLIIRCGRVLNETIFQNHQDQRLVSYFEKNCQHKKEEESINYCYDNYIIKIINPKEKFLSQILTYDYSNFKSLPVNLKSSVIKEEKTKIIPSFAKYYSIEKNKMVIYFLENHLLGIVENDNQVYFKIRLPISKTEIQNIAGIISQVYLTNFSKNSQGESD